MEIGNLPKKEFRVMIRKMIPELRKRMDIQSKKCLAELENMKNNQSSKMQ